LNLDEFDDPEPTHTTRINPMTPSMRAAEICRHFTGADVQSKDITFVHYHLAAVAREVAEATQRYLEDEWLDFGAEIVEPVKE